MVTFTRPSFAFLKDNATANVKLIQQPASSENNNEAGEAAAARSPPASPRGGEEDSPAESSKTEVVKVPCIPFASLKDTLTSAYENASIVASSKLSQSNHTTASDSETENKNEGAEDDDSPNSTESSKKNSQTRPLRLGSFNFDNPEANISTTSNGQSSTPHQALSFPPLFHEADDMLNLSNLIYTLVDLRNLAREGKLLDPDQSKRILDMPLPLGTALRILSTEGETLKQALDDGKHSATLSALESLLARQKEMMAAAQEKNNVEEESSGKKREGSMYGWITHWGADSAKEESDAIEVVSKQQEEIESSVMTAVGDLKNLEELVYAVGINSVEERITVTFRGSATTTDFMTDAKISIIQAPDPRRFNDTSSEGSGGGDVGIHQGFYEYLFGDSKEKLSKYAEIMDHIKQLLKEDPIRKTYKLYVTGHSLGGALSTLFGFYAAGSPSLPLPVTVISVASPRVGNINFARTFVELESQGKLRHLRIANHQDPITLGPTVSSKRALALSAKVFSPLGYLALVMTGNAEGGEEEVYYHTGIKMKLFKSGASDGRQCTLLYSGARLISGSKNPDAIDKDDVADINQSNKLKKKTGSAELPMASYHFGTCYSERMALAEPDLRGLTLNNLYLEKAGEKPFV